MRMFFANFLSLSVLLVMLVGCTEQESPSASSEIDTLSANSSDFSVNEVSSSISSITPKSLAESMTSALSESSLESSPSPEWEKESASQSSPTISENYSDLEDKYESLSEKELAAGIIPNERNDQLYSPSAEEQAGQDTAALWRYLKANVALNRRGDIYNKSVFLQIEYVDLETTQKAVETALESYTGTVMPIEYKQVVYTESQWNNIIKEIESVPSVKSNRDFVMSLGRELHGDYIRVRLLKDIPKVEKDILALGYGEYVRVEVETRTPVS